MSPPTLMHTEYYLGKMGKNTNTAITMVSELKAISVSLLTFSSSFLTT